MEVAAMSQNETVGTSISITLNKIAKDSDVNECKFLNSLNPNMAKANNTANSDESEIFSNSMFYFMHCNNVSVSLVR